MKISQFIISTKAKTEENLHLLYNTATTAFVSLDNKNYDDIFVQHNFTTNPLVKNLYQMGFLIDDEIDELARMQYIRTQSAHDSTTNITILPTTCCNARCAYCFEEGIHYYNMSKKTADAVVKYIVKNFPNRKLGIGWFGGEPLLKTDIIEYIIEKLKLYQFETYSHVTTNGSLISSKFLDYAKNNNFKSFQVTIDSVDDEYGEIKNYVDIPVKDAFSRTISGVKQLLQYGFRTLIRINFAASKIEKAIFTFDKLNEVLSPYIKNNNLYIYLAPLQLHDPKENICALDYNGIHPFMLATRHQFEQGHPFNGYKDSLNSRDKTLIGLNLYPTGYGCGMLLKDRVVIDADGSFYKCHRLVGKKQYMCGNVFDGLQYNDVYNYYIDMTIHDEECMQCNLLPICQGGCKTNAFLYGREQRCIRIKQVREELVQYYYELIKTKSLVN